MLVGLKSERAARETVASTIVAPMRLIVLVLLIAFEWTLDAPTADGWRLLPLIVMLSISLTSFGILLLARRH